MYGSNRGTSPRAVLRAHVDREVERIVGRAVSAVLSPEVPDDKAANLALRMIQQADPPTEATVEIKTELTNEDIQKMSYSELLATAERLGIDLMRPEEGASEGASDLSIPPELAQPGDPEAE